MSAFRRFNPGDISIRHHYTGDRIRVHSFMHKGYWYHGKRRERETMTLFALLLKPGDTVIEIGGHIGYISLYFANLVGSTGRVAVFEPGPNNLPYIRSNVGDKNNILLIEKAVADFSGLTDFYLESLTGQNNSLLPNYPRFDGNLRHTGLESALAKTVVQVDCVTLDDFLAQTAGMKPSLVKIDVEGAELAVLKGMDRILQSGNVALMVEVTDNAPAVYDLLTTAGFKAFTERRDPIRSSGTLAENSVWIKEADPRYGLFAPA
jgi:FkbM family methyltransferase